MIQVMSKYQNKYRNESARLQSWDYGANAAYFITICTARREHYFGEIVDSKQMKFSEIGQHAKKCWLDIPSHFPFVILDSFIVMPDHIIRNKIELERIRKYIISNPKNWDNDY